MGPLYQQQTQSDCFQQNPAQQEWLHQDMCCDAWLLQGWSSQAWETQRKEEQGRLKSAPATKSNKYTAPPPHLLPPFMEDAMVCNPDKPTSTWFTAGECKLVCALSLYVNTRESSVESVKRHGKCREPYIDEMHDEILRYLRGIFRVPWFNARVDSSGLYDYIKASNHKPLRNLFIEVREDPYGFWNAHARATFQWWVMLRTPLRERLKHEDVLKKMPDGTSVRQDSVLARYDDAKPILEAESLAAKHPKTYHHDIDLLPITQWLVAVSIKCMLSQIPPPPRIPYWPCNMVLTEERQTPAETSYSPQSYRKRGEQKNPAARKARGRRSIVSGNHGEAIRDLPRREKERVSLPINHTFAHQIPNKPPSAPRGFPHSHPQPLQLIHTHPSPSPKPNAYGKGKKRLISQPRPQSPHVKS